MNDDRMTENDISDDAEDAPESPGSIPLDDVRPAADADIARDIDGQEPGYTFPGPGA